MPELNETKITEFFAYFPVIIDFEIKWLKRVKVLWQYKKLTITPPEGYGEHFVEKWVKMKFLEV